MCATCEWADSIGGDYARARSGPCKSGRGGEKVGGGWVVGRKGARETKNAGGRMDGRTVVEGAIGVCPDTTKRIKSGCASMRTNDSFLQAPLQPVS